MRFQGKLKKLKRVLLLLMAVSTIVPMVGKFTGQDTPAVGFSIGFERIVMHNKSIIDTVQVPQNQKLIDINIPEEQLFRELKPAFSIKRRIRNMIPEQLKYIIKRL